MINITFVDDEDNVIGSGTKQEAQERGINHRVVRIFVKNSNEELLIQKRSANVAFPNLWDQSAGGHVDENEDYADAAPRELHEELGISNVSLILLGKYFTSGEGVSSSFKRFNAIFTTNYDGPISFNSTEVSDIKWISLLELKNWMQDKPEEFTKGFLDAFEYYMSQTSKLSRL